MEGGRRHIPDWEREILADALHDPFVGNVSFALLAHDSNVTVELIEELHEEWKWRMEDLREHLPEDYAEIFGDEDVA